LLPVTEYFGPRFVRAKRANRERLVLQGSILEYSNGGENLTLNAVLYADVFPLVVSDSLVSNESGETVSVTSPLLSEYETRPGPGKWRPVGLARKFWLLPDRTLFLYAGTIGAARAIFDRLASQVTPERRFDVDTFRAAQRFIEDYISDDVSFIAVSPQGDEEPAMVLAHGKTTVRRVGNYGRVIAIGTGSEPFLRSLESCEGEPPSDPSICVLNAYNVAAFATREYMATQSEFARKSSGGYFEVLLPWLFEQSYQWIYRGSVHAFFDIDERTTVLKRIVMARQTDKYTEVLGVTFQEVVHPSEI
jgi:hypothetical protein